MKAFAYPAGEKLNEYGLVELSELSISADAVTIRAIAKFLNDAADEMDKLGEKYDHVHMQDRSSSWKDSWTDIVVCKVHEEKT